MNPNDFATSALAWIAAGATIIASVLGVLAMLLPKIAAIKAQIEEMKSRQQAQSERLRTQEQGLTQVALATSPPAVDVRLQPVMPPSNL